MMKKLLLVLICLPFIGFGQPPIVNIPDVNFKAYLVGNSSINTNRDTEIQVSEATPFAGSINCSGLGIFDLTGIEAFTALTNLNCDQNKLVSLDVSANTALIDLVCFDNQLTSLDVSNNTALGEFLCYDNQLTSLDVSNNTVLELLFCYDNQLTSLDVSNNTGLERMICGSNQLTSLDVSNNTALELLDCERNQLDSLDVSVNTNLTELGCEQNQLTSLDARNGNNQNLLQFKVIDNPNLTCINVDDVTYSSNNWTNIDAQHYFSANCTLFVNLPDILNITNTERKLVKITDMLGRKTPIRINTPLLYIYNDGTTEKRIIFE